MKPSSLHGRTVQAVLAFRTNGVHPAWVSELTLPIVAYAAFLEFENGELVRIDPCEVDLRPERYSGLGLELGKCSRSSLRSFYSDSQHVDAMPLEETLSFSPFTIDRIEESDPMGDGLVSQYVLTTGKGKRITFRHILPPTMLGIEVTDECLVAPSEDDFA